MELLLITTEETFIIKTELHCVLLVLGQWLSHRGCGSLGPCCIFFLLLLIIKIKNSNCVKWDTGVVQFLK